MSPMRLLLDPLAHVRGGCTRKRRRERTPSVPPESAGRPRRGSERRRWCTALLERRTAAMTWRAAGRPNTSGQGVHLIGIVSAKSGVDAADDDGVLTGALHRRTQVLACPRDRIHRLAERHTARVRQKKDAAMVVLKLVRYSVHRPLRQERDVCDRLRAHGVIVDDNGLLTSLFNGRAYCRRRVFRPLRRQVVKGLT